MEPASRKQRAKTLSQNSQEMRPASGSDKGWTRSIIIGQGQEKASEKCSGSVQNCVAAAGLKKACFDTRFLKISL